MGFLLYNSVITNIRTFSSLNDMLGYLQTKDNNRISLKSREHHIRGVHSIAVGSSFCKKKSTKTVKVNIFLFL